ncbi:MAG: hypothetical protein HN590_04120 [Calditrichaeota bacterium]|nr:hypothetical protein [Calditrichota bacterium]
MQNLPERYILIIGAGSMATAITYDLILHQPSYDIVVLDKDAGAVKKFLAHPGFNGKVHGIVGDGHDCALMVELFKNAVAAVGSAGYYLNTDHTALAIETHTHWVDLGGNNTVVEQQFAMSERAKAAGVTVVPDCGLAPGMVSILAGDAVKRLDTVDELHFRVGGLPKNPEPPLNYGLCFSAEGLINEYVEPARLIEDGKVCEVPSLTGWESVEVGKPFGDLEAFHTSGGSSTMVETFTGKVKTLDYKTLRYPGHLSDIKLLQDIGLLDSEKLSFGEDKSVSPRQMMCAVLEKAGWVSEDLIVLVSWALGVRDGKRVKIEYRLLDYHDPVTGLSAMARTTGFSAAVVLNLILDGQIEERGVIKQELSVPPDEYLQGLAKRGLKIEIAEWYTPDEDMEE